MSYADHAEDYNDPFGVPEEDDYDCLLCRDAGCDACDDGCYICGNIGCEICDPNHDREWEEE